MSKKLLFKGGHATGMIPCEIEDFSTLYMVDARVDEKTKAYIDSVIGNSVLNLCPYRNVLVTHKYDTVEGNVVALDDCEDDEIIQLSEIQGNTMVNCNKDTDKELILMPNLDTNGYSNVTLTEGIDGGKVDVSLEGNTMVNVCDQEDPVAITKSYTVETGNHVALQGEYDGKCRPNVYGNTLVNLAGNSNLWEVGCSGDVNTDYTITSTNNQGMVVDKLTNNVSYLYFRKRIDPNLFKPSTTYTIIFNSLKANNVGVVSGNTAEIILPLTSCNDGYNVVKITSTDLSTITGKNAIYVYLAIDKQYIGTVKVSDVIVLEGDYTNKPIPDYFTGMKSSFEDKLVEDKLVLENLYKFSSRDDFYMLSDNVTLDGEYIKMTADGSQQNAMMGTLDTIKPSTTYTIIADVVENTLNSMLYITNGSDNAQLPVNPRFQVDAGKTGIFTQVVTTSHDLGGCVRCLANLLDSTNTTGSIKYRIMVVEGDYTNYDFTDYDSTKAGKYKVDYKVTGKNKLNQSKGVMNTSLNSKTICIKVKPDTSYVYSSSVYKGTIVIYELPYKVANGSGANEVESIAYKSFEISDTQSFTTGSATKYILMNYDSTSNIQIEEGTTATTYEPYKESIKTLYLNSPLLEGDTIEQSGNDIVHMHKYKTVTFDGSDDEKWVYWGDNTDNGKLDSSLISFYLPFTNYKDFTTSTIFNNKFLMANTVWGATTEIMALNAHNIMSFQVALLRSKLATQDLAGFKTWLQQNPITVAYELATPTKEVISTNDNLLLDSYTNGHLDVDSVIPIDKVVFQSYGTSLKYLSPNTEYTIQFESDNTGILNALALNGYDTIGNLNIVKGINKFNITTKAEITTNYLWTNGIGFNMSKIVVTPKVEQPFGYFKGMKSVGECEDNKIEILSRNKNLFYGDIEIGFINDTNGKEMGWSEYFRCKEYIPCKPDTRYISTFKYSDELKYCYLLCYDKNKEFISGIKSWELSKQKTPIGCAYIRIAGQCINSGVVVLSNISEILINEDTATDYIPHAENKKEILLNEPLRGLPNGIRDKYVIIDGKWYIERNTIQLRMDSTFIQNKTLHHYISQDYPDVIGFSTPNNWFKWNSSLVCDNLVYDGHRNISAGSLISNQEKIFVYDLVFITLNKNKLSSLNEAGFREYLKNNPITLVGQNTTPTYEPIDYNPFEVYTDTTHISNNSNIPCNMVIRNSGFNCMLKPNTTYTVSSNNGLSSVTTKASIGDGILRFYDKDTTSVTKMSKVLVLEGDYITGNPPIPAFFKGMESAFEQELVTDEKDEHYGKYKVNVKATNPDNSQQNNITFYIKEPLRGVGDVKDKVYVKEDKVVVERNCGSITFDGSEDWTWNASNAITLECRINLILNIKIGSENTRCDSMKPDYQGDYERIFLGTTDSFISLNKSKASTVDKFKAYLQQNPVKVVYQLATPTYEEVECDLSKLALEGYNHGTLFYDTNIPVTTQFYDFNVNIKDMLIPNETYYVTFNADRVKDIAINLSGVQVKYKTSMGYNKVPIQLGDVVSPNFSMDSRGVELSDLMISTSTSLIYVKDMNDVCVYDEATNKYSITITSTNGKESDKRVILLDYPLLRLNKDIYDRLYYSNKDNRYRIDKKVFKHKFTNEHEYSKYAAETNDTYYSSFISLNETIKDYVVITNEKVKTVKVEDDKYYFKIKWSDLGVSDKTEANGNQGMKDFFNNNEVYLYYATDGFVEIVDGLRRQTLKVYQPETFMKFSGNTTTTVTILIPMKNV